VYQAGTLSGNPLAMAAGVATLGHLDDDLYANLEEAAARLENGLVAAAEAAGASVRVSRLASMLTVFVDEDAYPAFFHAMLSAGFLLPPSQHEAWFISAAHRVEDLVATIDAARAAFDRIHEDR
jgi:glutamate-1-semialdehyde 2,1-aminomutase